MSLRTRRTSFEYQSVIQTLCLDPGSPESAGNQYPSPAPGRGPLTPDLHIPLHQRCRDPNSSRHWLSFRREHPCMSPVFQKKAY
ncbi:hypothetical protein SCLCIDRAFT_1218510 [Scleroderma citrinum Foug A]|uniref:Uncharacterized protein n=1 Tax=Scleroderma citrinum Foug A TaxID=1036808 RepID=A0A0C3DCV8_9AGAM|nr:hypothetical protein SCLCIDRAFT_1218510 [Scleroderma citrinum Foug A]